MQAEPVADLNDAHIMENLATRLLDLAEDTAQVGKSVSALTANMTTPMDSGVIQDLQKLDSLQQSLRDLAHLSAALAGPGALRAQALDQLKLKATRTLLDTSASERPTAQGTVDLF
ncbi:hypothetical protein [uncultured Tateyamaria sp.]|uniref:hypothetical protein n=1 Tax=uncultured Tateyamaria sp. TaxID=455651 RepID=UPI00262D65F1|nr:hypothetical protein [uncultured Tateyamaria sp.]